MTRFGLLTGAALIALASCGEREEILVGPRMDLRGETGQQVDRALPITLPAPVTLGAWTHKAAAADHDIPHASFSAQPRLAMSVPIGQGEDRRHRISADPVVSDGRIYTVDSRARVTALTTAGQPIWSASASPAGEPVNDASGAGLAVSGGRLFVSTAFGQLIAMNAATGQRLWTQDLGAAAAGAPTVVGDRVYVIGRDATAWALDANTGRVRWTAQGTPSPSGVVGGAAPAVSGDMIVLPFASRELHGLLRDGGTSLWTSTVAGTRVGRVYASITDISGDPVIDGGTVYAGSPSGRIDAFELSSGRRLWSAEEGAMSPVVVAGGSVFAVSDQAELVRLDAATGARIWGTELPYFKTNLIRRRKDVYAHYGPVLGGGRLWVASSDGRLRGFSPRSGALEVDVPLPDGAATNPVIAGGVLYVVNTAGRLLAFR